MVSSSVPMYCFPFQQTFSTSSPAKQRETEVYISLCCLWMDEIPACLPSALIPSFVHSFVPLRPHLELTISFPSFLRLTSLPSFPNTRDSSPFSNCRSFFCSSPPPPFSDKNSQEAAAARKGREGDGQTEWVTQSAGEGRKEGQGRLFMRFC